MTQKKPPSSKATSGPKSENEKLSIDKQLRDLFDEDGCTPWRASLKVKCSYPYAVQKFKDFAAMIVDAEEQDWIERIERIRARALEGISVKIETAKEDVKLVLTQLSTNKKFQDAAIIDTVAYLKKSPIGIALGKLDEEAFFDLVAVLRKELDVHKAYGFLINNNLAQLRADRIYAAELQQQYDAIEILPPPSAVLEAELEKRIAERNNIRPAIPDQKE